MKLTVFDTHDFEEADLRRAFADGHDVRFLKSRLTPETAVLAENSDAIVIFVHDSADARTLVRLRDVGVRYVLLRSAGFNHVDVKFARELGLRVARVPEYSPYAVAEHAAALMLCLNRKIHRAYNRVREGNFSLGGLVGFDMHGRTAGIVGTGRIGRAMAAILRGFGMTLLAHDARPDPVWGAEAGVTYADLASLLRKSDIVTLHLPLTPATHHLIDGDALGLLKPGAMLVNTSRGALVDARAAIATLKTGRLGALGLDVYEEEDALFFEDHSQNILQDDVIARLMTFPNVIITSHQGFLTADALLRIADVTAANAACFAAGKPCENEIF